MGGQVCSDDGTRFGPCDCALPGTDGGPGLDATSDASGPTLDATAMDANLPGDSSSDAFVSDSPSGDVLAQDASSSDVLVPDAPSGDAAACSGGRATTISGKVYDPAGKNPLYNVAVFVPAAPLQPLPKGVPTGADACSCGALYKSGALTSTVTGVDGSFTLPNVPAGNNVPLVLQIGKWRRSLHVNVTACQDNPQPDKSLALPGTVTDPDDNMPDIAVSTGASDSLECLMLRMGLPKSEYVAGAGGAGHVHVFSGGAPNGRNVGLAEANPMPGAPASFGNLWDTAAHLMPYDITLLSGEGGETYNANPPVLEQYLNAGGRAIASHDHYAWFTGPLVSMQSYTAPLDWGSNLANWSVDTAGGSATDIGGIPVITLNGYSLPFPKGVAFQQWLSDVNALGQGGVPSTELSIYRPRYNAVVGSSNKASQPWITSDSSGTAGQTMYFTFNTPVDLNPPPPGTGTGAGPVSCGRVAFTDIHVAGNPGTSDTSPPPAGCDDVDLSPQERALEFMLFDLSSCVIPDTATPPTTVPPAP